MGLAKMKSLMVAPLLERWAPLSREQQAKNNFPLAFSAPGNNSGAEFRRKKKYFEDL
jgi:hypothetical protein